MYDQCTEKEKAAKVGQKQFASQHRMIKRILCQQQNKPTSTICYIVFAPPVTRRLGPGQVGEALTVDTVIQTRRS